MEYDYMIPRDSSHARDAGLRKLALTKHWLLAGSVSLTGVLTAVAAHAFPGRTINRSATQATNVGHSRKAATHHQHHDTQNAQSSPGSLKPPAQAPPST